MSIKSGANFVTDGLVFDIDPGNSKSYLLSNENRLSNSISISSSWANNGTVTKTSNYATAPDGTTTAIKFRAHALPAARTASAEPDFFASSP